MTETIVRRAHQAFRDGDYAQAIRLYREASDALGSHLFAANLRLCEKRLHSVRASETRQRVHLEEYADPNRRIKFADRFRVALIADEFTTNSFKDEFVAIPIEPASWRDDFEQHKPEIFFCESAWSGPDSSRRPWKGKVYASKNFPKENRTVLLEILAHCRKEGIPTVFWNKEDPTHFTDKVHDFVKTAKEFDFVFTTAQECVDRYKKEHRVRHVFVLPFATNPRLFNPIETAERSSRVVFAGSWYANHVQRSKDMERILDSILADGYELEIYDRYHGDNDPLHVWPPRFQRYLRSSLPHDRMPSVYKSSRFGLNFNTVTDSLTMFSRRVYELMSSNTLVISNYSRGTDEMFGDLVVYPDKQPERLRSLTAEEIDRLRDRALHKVLGEHTYRHRWIQILQDIGVNHIARKQAITLTCLVKEKADALRAVAWFQQHGRRGVDSRLLLIASVDMPDLDVADLYQQFNRYGVTVTSYSHAARYAISDRYQPVETSHFMTFSTNNPPPADWLQRAALHLQYTGESALSPAPSHTVWYRYGFADVSAPVLDLRDRFGLWLAKPHDRRYVYFV